MARISLVNMAIGFLVLTFAACAGAIMSFDITDIFLNNPQQLQSWKVILQRSAHGHSNLFGMLHILFGLTFPYSNFSVRIKWLQTSGLFLGTFAIGPLLVMRSFYNPSHDLDLLTALSGFFLSAALVALMSHAYALSYRAFKS